MSKPIYINVFLNDKFSDITDAMYQKRDQISQETGRNCPPYLRKSSGKDYKAKSIGEDTSVFGKPPRNDDDPDGVPF